MDPRMAPPRTVEIRCSRCVCPGNSRFSGCGWAVKASLKPPSGLGPAGRSLWRRVVADVPADVELDARDLIFLEQAGRASDRVSELEELIARDGLMIAGSKGQDRLHPAVAEARMQRQLVAVLLSKIELDVPGVKTGSLNVRQRADLRRVAMRQQAGV